MAYNKIIYGAPGVGKSKSISDIVKEDKKWVVTFHPEYSYHDFIGGYKPAVKKIRESEKFHYYDSSNDEIKEKDYYNYKTKIIYEFMEGPFLSAYIDAWKEYLTNKKNVYLQIEEINRGNCAAIFGDVFQLLDRDRYGFSEYYININHEISVYLRSELGEAYEIELSTVLASKGIAPPENIFSILLLPNNLTIIATMNTSDQSLFPLDSAFKRRWIWEYLPINYEIIKISGRKIRINDVQYNWGEFLENINYIIFKLTESEDKCLGPYFVKENEITEDIFKGKILYYLWFEVFKDESLEVISKYLPKSERIIAGEALDEAITYSEFYDETNGDNYMKQFMKNIGVNIENLIETV